LYSKVLSVGQGLHKLLICLPSPDGASITDLGWQRLAARAALDVVHTGFP
jgi:hypothetical protein